MSYVTPTCYIVIWLSRGLSHSITLFGLFKNPTHTPYLTEPFYHLQTLVRGHRVHPDLYSGALDPSVCTNMNGQELEECENKIMDCITPFLNIHISVIHTLFIHFPVTSKYYV